MQMWKSKPVKGHILKLLSESENLTLPQNNCLYYPVTAAFIVQSYIVLMALTDN